MVNSAPIPSSVNEPSEQNIDELLAAMQADVMTNNQEPDWLLEFNKNLDNENLDFDFGTFLSKMSDDEIQDFFDFFTIALTDDREVFSSEND